MLLALGWRHRAVDFSHVADRPRSERAAGQSLSRRPWTTSRAPRKVAPATLYRRFPNKDALVAAVLVSFFDRLIALARAALAEPPERCLDTYVLTVAHELAASRGLSHGAWVHVAPGEQIDELRSLTATLLQRAQHGGGISPSLTVGDIAAAIWALRGIIQTSDQVAPDA